MSLQGVQSNIHVNANVLLCVFVGLHCFRSPLSDSSESSEKVAEKEAIYQVSSREIVKELKSGGCP